MQLHVDLFARAIALAEAAGAVAVVRALGISGLLGALDKQWLLRGLPIALAGLLLCTGLGRS